MTTPSSKPTTNVTGTSAPDSSSSRSAAGLSMTATQRPRPGAVELDDLGADQVVHPECVRVVDRFGVQAGVGEPLGRRAIGDPLEAHQPALRLLGGGGDREPLPATPAAANRVEALGAVGRQVDVDVAAQAMRPRDAPDLEQALGCSGTRAIRRRTLERGAAEASSPDHQSSRNSMSTSTPSFAAAARVTVRTLAAVRPRRPITRPRSPAPTRTSRRARCPIVDSSTVTASGSSTIDRTM